MTGKKALLGSRCDLSCSCHVLFIKSNNRKSGQIPTFDESHVVADVIRCTVSQPRVATHGKIA